METATRWATADNGRTLKGWAKPARRRDSQRSKVNAAENAAFFTGESEGMTVDEVERFVVEMWQRMATQTALRRNGLAGAKMPRVEDGRGRRSACGCPSGISIPRWARSRWVVCHELAHAVTWGPGAEAHGPEFCRTYLSLIETALGFEARERLGFEMRKRNVRTRP